MYPEFISFLLKKKQWIINTAKYLACYTCYELSMEQLELDQILDLHEAWLKGVLKLKK